MTVSASHVTASNRKSQITNRKSQITMFLHSDDARLWYEVRGRGPDVVLLHPFPVDHTFWEPVAAALTAHYRCLLYDLRGHGESEPGVGPATMEKHVADVLRLCDAAGMERAVFCGVSIGGYVLFELWRRQRERVRALGLGDTRATADDDEGRRKRRLSIAEVEQHGPAGFFDSMTQALVGETTRRNRPDVAAAVRAMMRMSVAGIAAVQEGMAARPDSVSTLKTIHVPTLVLVGDEDQTTPRADAELLHRHIAGSRREVIPSGGHFAVFEQPETAGRLLRSFLDGLTTG